jgi:hypothetical protein
MNHALTDDRRLEIENAVNRCIRHCRIGKVRVKPPIINGNIMDNWPKAHVLTSVLVGGDVLR